MNFSELVKSFSSRLFPCPLRVYNLTGSSISLFLSLIEEPFVMVDETEESALKIWQDIQFYKKVFHSDVSSVCFLPLSDGADVTGKRAEAIYRLFCEKTAQSVVTSKNALMQTVWLPDVLKKDILRLSVSTEIERDAVKEKLEALGYSSVPLVTENGQYSMRGWILDVFPSTEERPFRVEFFGDVIDSIRVFDVETQRSVSGVDAFSIMPAKEPDDGKIFYELTQGMKRFYSESVQEIPEDAVVLSRFAVRGEGIDAGLVSFRGYGILPDERKDIDELARAVKELSRENRVIVISSSDGQAERLKEVFKDGGVISPVVGLEELMDYEGRVSISVGELSAGLFIPGLVILTENEIFGGRPAYRAIKKSKVSRLVKTIEDLTEGDYIVHRDYGIGRFKGLVRQSIEGYECDLMTIEYAGGDKLYLPLYAVDKVQKYRAEEGIVPRLDRLGGKGWQRTKERIRKRLKEMAGKLLRLYAEREVSKGFSFSRDTELHREFDRFFPYEETPDQIKTIEEIKRDMESSRPMDRLLCGDVGYGKTEVAMRAAFKAVYDGKQVAVLVPTTLLCEQHYRIFKKRFSAFPVTIDYLSRFKPKRAQIETIKNIEKGRIDIVIATHALLRNNVSFRNLGLFIIDEEHRFGVRQKERIKELKKGIDVLTLSATPIPRTLQMALSGIRAMSVIETPPEERLAVKSIVSVFNETVIKEAIDREITRGGQVFFVHNRIQDIDKVERFIRRIVPYARVAVAHGQMREGQLEKIMMAFLDMQVDVLVCTAIIGSGLDIPTANTIIINMADRMGLADLYQLKGRVGRSNVRAFAYYLIPGEHVITEEARKRLQAIQELSYMGAGFRLAMKDLEIRGAGNLLGAEQSGHIHAVGFDMYIEMLERAVAELKGIEVREKVRPTINIRLNAFIPEDYITDMALRLGVYRSIAYAKTIEELEDIEAEMADRFGSPPQEFRNLLGIMMLRLLAEKLLITDISQSDGKVRFVFAEDARLAPERVLKVFNNRVRFQRNGFELSLKGNVFEDVKNALETLVNEEQGTVSLD
jgi:transcription-repair coupling factor (superfamily II helicase)